MINRVEKPLFSILIANYNNGKYLTECLQSALNQTYENIEIVIVDDCSQDNSINIISKLIIDSRVKFFRNEVNRGCGFTKRKCIEISNGEILGFIDSDDKITSNAVQIMVNKHLDKPEYSVVYSTHYICDHRFNIKCVNSRIQQVDENGYYCNTSKQVSHFATFKREAYNKTIGIDARLKRAVDQDLYYKLEEVGQFHFINEPLYLYRIHKNGISTGNNSLKADYWHNVVRQNTYFRRKIRNERNIKWKNVRKGWINYYIKFIYFNIQGGDFSLSKHFYLIYKLFIYSRLRNIPFSIKLAILPLKLLLNEK